MLPDIDSLALFVRAAELRSLTKAAKASYIGLAAASRRLALLELGFKTTLLERSSKGVELTPAGASLLPHAKALLNEVNEMHVEMSEHICGRKGAVRILANTSVMTESLPKDLATFTNKNPEIKIALQERWSNEIVRLVLCGEADLGIVVEGVQTEGLDTHLYKTDQISVLLPRNHPLSQRREIKFNDLVDNDLITLQSGSSIMRLLTERALISERNLQLTAQVRSFEAVTQLVQAGLGVGLLPQQVASKAAQALGLIVRTLDESWAKRRMLICIKKERVSKGCVTHLMEHLRYCSCEQNWIGAGN